MTSKNIFNVLLAILFAVPGVIGLIFFEAIVRDWVVGGFVVSGAFAAFGSIVLLYSVSGITLSVLLLGLLLRSYKTDWSRKISLGLAIFEFALLCLLTFMMRTYDLVFLDIVSFAPLVTFVLVVPGALIGVLPAFLYWLRGGPSKPV